MVSKKLQEVVDKTRTQKLFALIAVKEAQKILNLVDDCELWFTCDELILAKVMHTFGTYNINVHTPQDLAYLLCKPEVEPEVVYREEHKAAANLNITVEMWSDTRGGSRRYFTSDYNETDGFFYRDITKADIKKMLKNIIKNSKEYLYYQ